MDFRERIAELEIENAQLKAENIELRARLEERKRPKQLECISKIALENRWLELSDDWKKALQHAFLRQGETIYLPSEKDLRALFRTEKLEIIGNGILLFGLEQLSFKLSDLSGLQYFSQLKELNLAGNNLKNLKGIEHLKHLELLNLTANQLTTLRGLRYLKGLKSLLVRDNKLKNLSEIQHLTQLEILDCIHNNNLQSLGFLMEITTLHQLYVYDFKEVIQKEVEALKMKLPNLDIFRI